MTPEEARQFLEEDEDPQELWERFAAAPELVTRRPADADDPDAGWAGGDP